MRASHVWKTEGEVFGYGPHIFFGFIRTKPHPRED